MITIPKRNRGCPSNLVVDRFGLNADSITRHGISWIDNLTTGSGKDLSNPKHPKYGAYRIAEYCQQYGVKKCEANALVTRINEGRQLCQDAILKYFDPEALKEHEARVEELRQVLREAVSRRVA